MNEKKPFANPDIETHHGLAIWAAACSEHILYLFERTHPYDNRPKLALDALHEWVLGDRTMVSCREAAFAAHAVAREAQEPDAKAAARAAGQAASVPHMYTHCSISAEYATIAAALSVSDDLSEEAAEKEREWQWQLSRKDLRPVGFPHGKGMTLKIK